MRLNAFLLLLPVFFLKALGQEEKKPAPIVIPQEIQDFKIPDGKTVPAMEKTSSKSPEEAPLKLGKVSIFPKEKKISIPAYLNMREGLIEYMVSMPHGKMHETLFVTVADPLHVSVAAKLLNIANFRGKLFPERDDNMEWKPYKEPKREDFKHALVGISVSWQKDGKTVTYPIGELVSFKKTSSTLPPHQWVFIDSSDYKGAYQASVIGDLVAIFGDSNALIAYSGIANDGENVWMAKKELLPEQATPVTITFEALNPELAEKPVFVRPADDLSPEEPSTPANK